MRGKNRSMPFDLVKEALLASGLEKDHQVAEYTVKLGHLHRQFVHEMKPGRDPLTGAKALFDWLWIKKPDRYERHGRYRLNHTIDSQLSKEKQAVGNCLGLTLLYNCLLHRSAIDAAALHLENAFGIGPHVLTLLETGESVIDIENILPQGFDYKGHLKNPSRTIWGDRELVADIYHSRGNEYYEKGCYREALRSYDIAIRLNPRYESACLNKAIVLDRTGASTGMV